MFFVFLRAWDKEKTESLWERASERGIRRSDVRFLKGTRNFFLCPTLVTKRKASFPISLLSSKLTIFLILNTILMRFCFIFHFFQHYIYIYIYLTILSFINFSSNTQSLIRKREFCARARMICNSAEDVEDEPALPAFESEEI